MLLSDLLPALFDLVVLDTTGRALLPVEREGILDALVNCVGESVMRQARASAGDIEIQTIITDDRFSDKWISRTEVVGMMGQSSGLARELSEFALVLIESRLDVSIGDNGATISEIGTFHISSPSPQMLLKLDDYTRKWWLGDEFPFSARLTLQEGIPSPFWLFRGWRRGSTSHLLEKALLFSSFRRSTPYNITLSKGLAYTRHRLVFSDVDVIGSTKESGLS
jgi:hypothetical protein